MGLQFPRALEGSLAINLPSARKGNCLGRGSEISAQDSWEKGEIFLKILLLFRFFCGIIYLTESC